MVSSGELMCLHSSLNLTVFLGTQKMPFHLEPLERMKDEVLLIIYIVPWSWKSQAVASHVLLGSVVIRSLMLARVSNVPVPYHSYLSLSVLLTLCNVPNALQAF